MQELGHMRFEPFRLDLGDERLWRAEEPIHLNPKAFGVLRCLVTQAGQLVTKEALLSAVWPESAVSESVLTVAIRQLRRALGDQARAPRFIETVHWRGYRFIASVTTSESTTPSDESGLSPLPNSNPLARRHLVERRVQLVGRDADLIQMDQWFATSLAGERQVGFISGEAGIGKTALVDAFVDHVRTSNDLWVGHGQCIEQYGSGEPYLPLLEALGRLCRGPEGTHFLALLRQHAPSWIAQMPVLLPSDEREPLARQESSMTQVRMLRELAEALAILTVERPLLLVLEDVHWSDISTLEWLAYVARRREPARLLILVTYRPVETIVHAHPLRQVVTELRPHRQCHDLVLDYLPEPAVASYLTHRFFGTVLPKALVRALHHRTNGNPLFLIAVVDDLLQQNILVEEGSCWILTEPLDALEQRVPVSLHLLIELHVDRLPSNQQTLLEAASVSGHTFSVAEVAVALDTSEHAIEATLTGWARQGQFVQADGTQSWPDGTVAARYRFVHALYHQVVYQRVSAGQLIALHQCIGRHKEAAYGSEASTIAAELGIHFERGHDPSRAVSYWHQAGQTALQRSAYQEAIAYIRSGLALLEMMSESAACHEQELNLQRTLMICLVATKGRHAPEVVSVEHRLQELYRQVDASPLLPESRWSFYHMRAELRQARKIAEQRLQHEANEPFDLVGHRILGQTLLCLGELHKAQSHLEQGLVHYHAQPPNSVMAPRLQEPGVSILGDVALVLYLLGYPDQALATSLEALDLAKKRDHPYSQAYALDRLVMIHFFRREFATMRDHNTVGLALATEYDFGYWQTIYTIWQGWLFGCEGHVTEGIAQMCQGLATCRSMGTEITRPFELGKLAPMYASCRQVQDGLMILDDALALVEQTEERWYEAELYRLKGDLLLSLSPQDLIEAEPCFHQAISIAQNQSAKSLELRAATSLARLWQSQGQGYRGFDLLAPIYKSFTEGFDTLDLIDAKDLLDELRESSG